MKTSFIKLLFLISSLVVAHSAFAQVGVSYGTTTSLGSYLQSNTSFVDGVYNERTWSWPATFDPTFTVGGLTFTKVSNFQTFSVGSPTLAVTLISVGYTEQVPYDIGFRVGSTNTNIFSDLNNANKPFDTRTTFLTSPTSTPMSISMYTMYQDVTRVSQGTSAGWAFYNVIGTSTYLAFTEVGVSSGIDFNDGVVLFEAAIPEPSTYGLLLGIGTMAIVLYRRRK